MWKKLLILMIMTLFLAFTATGFTTISKTNISTTSETDVYFDSQMNFSTLWMNGSHINFTRLYLNYTMLRQGITFLVATDLHNLINVSDGGNYTFSGSCSPSWANTSWAVVNQSSCNYSDKYAINWSRITYDTSTPTCNTTNTTYYNTTYPACNYCSPVNASSGCINSSHTVYNDTAYPSCCDLTYHYNGGVDCINGDNASHWYNLIVADGACLTPEWYKYDTEEGSKMDYYLIITGIGLFGVFMIFLAWFIITYLDDKYKPMALLALGFFLMSLILIGWAVLEGAPDCEIVINQTQEVNNVTTNTHQVLCEVNDSESANAFFKTIMSFVSVVGVFGLLYLSWTVFEWLTKRRRKR